MPFRRRCLETSTWTAALCAAVLPVALALFAGACFRSSGGGGSGGGSRGGAMACCAASSVCLASYAGDYSGSYSGSASGTWSVFIDASGAIEGDGEAGDGSGTFGISGQLDPDGLATFGIAAFSATFEGELTPDGRLRGTWSDSEGGASGSFSGSRSQGAIELPSCEDESDGTSRLGVPSSGSSSSSSSSSSTSSTSSGGSGFAPAGLSSGTVLSELDASEAAAFCEEFAAEFTGNGAYARGECTLEEVVGASTESECEAGVEQCLAEQGAGPEGDCDVEAVMDCPLTVGEAWQCAVDFGAVLDELYSQIDCSLVNDPSALSDFANGGSLLPASCEALEGQCSGDESGSDASSVMGTPITPPAMAVPIPDEMMAMMAEPPPSSTVDPLGNALMCPPPAEAPVSSCGDEDCPPTELFDDLLCVSNCCTAEGQCGRRNDGPGGSGECVLPPEPDPRCPSEVFAGLELVGCCTDDNQCGLLATVDSPCLERTAVPIETFEAIACDPAP